MAAQWETEGFGSQKQFIFLQQSETTRSFYPWSRLELQEKTRQAVRLLHELIIKERPEDWAEELDARMDDDDLSTELCLFYRKCVQKITIRPSPIRRPCPLSGKDGREESIYKTQLMAYYPI